jgi:bifunctional non-homologous end joining protein LigD
VIPPGQYGAGEVIVWDCGVYSPDEGGVTCIATARRRNAKCGQGIAAGKLSIELRGKSSRARSHS